MNAADSNTAKTFWTKYLRDAQVFLFPYSQGKWNAAKISKSTTKIMTRSIGHNIHDFFTRLWCYCGKHIEGMLGICLRNSWKYG